MKLLISEPQLAREIGTQGREVALQRFNIQRFTNDWETLFNEVTATSKVSAAQIV
jgi:glycosyltransferase involved in cell wall biosynthesis